MKIVALRAELPEKLVLSYLCLQHSLSHTPTHTHKPISDDFTLSLSRILLTCLIVSFDVFYVWHVSIIANYHNFVKMIIVLFHFKSKWNSMWYYFAVLSFSWDYPALPRIIQMRFLIKVLWVILKWFKIQYGKGTWATEHGPLNTLVTYPVHLV